MSSGFESLRGDQLVHKNRRVHGEWTKVFGSLARMRYGEIYKIETPGGVYIGQCVGWATGRWSQHLRLLRAGRHHCAALQESYTDGGISSFAFSVLEAEVPEEELDDREFHHQTKHEGRCISMPPWKAVRHQKQMAILDRIKQGIPYRRIADEFDVSLGTVGNVKKRYICSVS